MCSALVVFGLALVLALQIVIHRRLADIPAHAAAQMTLEVRSRARAESDALHEGTAKSVGEIVKSLQQHHDRIQRYQFELHESYHAETAALRDRAREREVHANIFADLVAVLREITNDLQALRGENNRREATEAPLRVPERRPPPVPRAAMPHPPPAEELTIAARPPAGPPASNDGAER